MVDVDLGGSSSISWFEFQRGVGEDFLVSSSRQAGFEHPCDATLKDYLLSGQARNAFLANYLQWETPWKDFSEAS